MNTHRPWQPHMSNSPLLDPDQPTNRATTLDHFDLIEEERDEMELSGDEPQDEARYELVMKYRD